MASKEVGTNNRSLNNYAIVSEHNVSLEALWNCIYFMHG